MAVHPGCGLPALHRGDDIQPIRLILREDGGYHHKWFPTS